MVTINVGQAKVEEGHLRLIHIIEIPQYEDFVNKLRSLLENDLIKKHSSFQFLKYELNQIQDIINNIKPLRLKRSIDIIGTAWKWLAGSPDHDDFELIKNKINNVLENNNKQILINKEYTERINKLISMINDLKDLIKKYSKVTDQMTFNIQYKLKIMKEDLINIRYAIHWAKQNIINSMILSKSEIKLVTETLEKGKLPYISAEEALDFASLKIITNGTCIFYIINIPLTTNETFEKLVIKPIKRNNMINEISYNNILRNKNKI